MTEPALTTDRIRQFRKIAIANRGEAAMRLIRAARDLAAERGVSIETIALVTPPDVGALFAREADTVVMLEVPAGSGAAAGYLDPDRVITAALSAGADALWAGWGFLSEDPRLAERAAEAGIVFIGPPPGAMRLAGDKIDAKRLAERCGIPVVPWSGEAIATLEEVRGLTTRIGFPLILKAAAGGGGRGIRIVRSPDELRSAFVSATGEAQRAFGDGRVFIERCVTRARHLEVQIVVDLDGTAIAYGVRDCTLQRRHQKVIEECPGPVATPEMVATLERHALTFARAAGYRNAGTVEFIVDLDSGAAYFMEMNARLQVEHPVTELVYGIDLVRLQLDVALGRPLAPAPEPRGAAIEVRLNAEDPDDGFAPAPGRLARFVAPLGPGIRVDSGVVEGSDVPPDFDSNIAKIIAFGATRAEALARLRRAIGETVVLVRGGATNKGLLAELLTDPEVIAGTIDTGWLDRRIAGTRPFLGEALAVAAVLGFREDGRQDLTNFIAAVARGVPQGLPDAGTREVRLRIHGGRVALSVLCVGYGRYRVTAGGVTTVVAMGGNEPGHATVGARRFRLVAQSDERAFVVELDGVCHRIARDPGGMVRAPAPAMVMDLAVAVGDIVHAGQRLGALEAMKMEIPLVAPEDGRVREVRVGVSSQVSAGQALVVLESLGADVADAVVPDMELGAAPDLFLEVFSATGELRRGALDRGTTADRRALSAAVAWEATGVLLGYGIEGDRVEKLLRLLDAEAAFERLLHPEDWTALGDVLWPFVDVQRLFTRDVDESMAGAPRMSNEARFWEYARHLGSGQTLPVAFGQTLRTALAHYGANEQSPTPVLRHVIARLAVAHARRDGRAEMRHRIVSGILRALMALHRAGADIAGNEGLRTVLEQLPVMAEAAWPFVADNAMQTRYVVYHLPRFERRERDLARLVAEQLDRVASFAPTHPGRVALVDELVDMPHSVARHLARASRADERPEVSVAAAEILFRRIYEALTHVEVHALPGVVLVELQSDARRVLGVVTSASSLDAARDALAVSLESGGPAAVDILVHPEGQPAKVLAEHVRALAESLPVATRVCLIVADEEAAVVPHWTFTTGEGAAELPHLRHLHPELGERLELWRLSEFDLTRAESHDRLVVFHARAKSNPRDERLFVVCEVRDVPEGEVLNEAPSALMAFEHAFHEAMRALREVQVRREVRARYHWNRVTLHVRPVVAVSAAQFRRVAARLAPYTDGLGLERVVVRARRSEPPGAPPEEIEIRFANPTGHRVEVRTVTPGRRPIASASPYELKVRAARAQHVTYPYEVVRYLTQADPPGDFVEHDLDERTRRAVAVDRAPGGNVAGVVFGVLTTFTAKVPEGLERVMVLSDPLHRMGALAEPECERIIAALDLAEARGLPVEWLATSAGALIAMDSGTENLDWTARVLRRIIEFTRGGGVVHVIVDSVNVGAQSYFNAEATMLFHTRGLLIMTPRGSMVLTGKKALDASGGVSAEDERGIGGYERVMGPNGEAQVLAKDLRHAFRILACHYDVSYIVPGEHAVRRFATTDPESRDVTADPYVGEEPFTTIGDIFSSEKNPERKKPFAMRSLMHAVADRDAPPLERFGDVKHGDTAIIWDTHLGGHAITLIGIESRSVPRRGWVPGDGPDAWTGGTLFPASSKKVARALRGASGIRPVVVLANLSGFDGSPESMRRLQLEYGAEIGRAVVEFRGRIVFCVVARYHGGAYVVFSKALNSNLVSLAVEGSYASVIGGAPAAAVVFPREVTARTNADPRVKAARAALEVAPRVEQPRLRERLARLTAAIHAEKQTEVAREFDATHSVARAKAVGSLDDVIKATELRPRLIEALSHGATQE